MAQKTIGRYRILGELGRGAMGVVYRAVDPLIEREVALKTLHADLPEDVAAELRVRFLREARSAGRLNHPNIVTIFDVGQEGGIAYIAMELLEGPSLLQMLKERQRIPFHSAADILAQVADALHHAHQHSIVHRDVKPANVVVSRAGRAKLTDFGVAYVPASDVTQHGAALGSPRYMAPEQVLGQPIDARADVFSLGVVLYELLTRRTPFEWPGDTTVFALMQRIAGEPHPPLRQIDAAIPAGFDRIMDRALAKRPQDRYQSAGEFAADLRNYQSLGGGTAFADTVPQPTLRSPLAAAAQQKVRDQLIGDLDQFAKNFEAEEKARLGAEEAARARKEQAVYDWGAAEERKREAFQRGQPAPAAPDTDPKSMTTTRRMEAVEIMRQQAAFRKKQAEAKPRAMAALDAAMRAALQYLTEFGKEMNEHQPSAGAPYEFIYVGKLPAVTLGQAAAANRTLKLPEGKELLAQVQFRYSVRPAAAPAFMLLGEDVARCEQYLKSLRVEFQQRAGAPGRPVQFTVAGPLPCEVNIRADYEAATATVELVNVRRFGRVTVRLDTGTFKDAIDDLARYVLGVDEDFRKLIAGG